MNRREKDRLLKVYKYCLKLKRRRNAYRAWPVGIDLSRMLLNEHCQNES